MTDEQHSKIGASSAYRWMACPGSVALCEGMPKKGSVYAAEGTAAHALGESILKEWLATGVVDAEKWLGAVITGKEQKFTVDQNMINNVMVYVDAVMATYQPGDVVAIEQQFNLDAFFPGMFGTNDASIYRPATGELFVFDLKYGVGVPVEVEQNKQLLYYGLGAATVEPGRSLSDIELVIAQPRGSHPDGPVRAWRTDALYLLEWSAELVDAARRTREPNATLCDGDHCRFCAALAVCPRIKDVINAMAEKAFTVDVDSLSGDELAVELERADVAEMWLRRIREVAFEQALAGNAPPGWKLVDKRAIRSWTSADEAARVLSGMGMAEADIYKPRELVSPAQAETACKKVKKDFGLLSGVVQKVSSGSTLVRDTDRRPASQNALTIFSPA